MSKILAKQKFRGLYTRFPMTKNLPNSAAVAENVKILGYGYEPVKGTKLFGQEETFEGERILDAYTFNLLDGSQLAVRIRETATENILEWYDVYFKKWQILLTGLTKGSETTFTDYNTSEKSALYFGNGHQAYSVWSGLQCRLTQAVALHDTTINVDDNSAYPASGVLVYNGQEISYTSKPSATSFAVADAHASEGDDDTVVEAVDNNTYGGVALSDILISLANRIYLVNAEDPNSIEYSVEGDATDFTTTANRAGAGVEDFPVFGGKITGLAGIDKYLVIFKANSIILFTWEYPTETTKTPSYKEIAVAENIGAITHKGIAIVGNQVYYVSKNGIRALSRVLSQDSYDEKTLSDIIQPTIKDYDFSNSKSIYYEKEDVFLVACKSDSDQENNNRVIAMWHYTDPETGARTFDYSILPIPADCFFIYGGKIYYGSSMDGNTYELFTGETYQGTPIKSIYTDNRNDFGDKNLKHAEMYLVEGLISEGGELEYTFLYDGGYSGSQPFKIKASASYTSKKAVNTIGSYKLGEEVIGGVYDDLGSLRPFRVLIELQDIDFFDLQIQRICKKAGCRYLIYYEGLVDPSINYNLSSDAE